MHILLVGTTYFLSNLDVAMVMKVVKFIINPKKHSRVKIVVKIVAVKLENNTSLKSKGNF